MRDLAYPCATNGTRLSVVSAGSFTVMKTRHAPGLVLDVHRHAHPCIVVPLAGSFSERRETQSRECLPGSVLTEHPDEPHENRFGPRGALNIVVGVKSATLAATLEPSLHIGAEAVLRVGESLARHAEGANVDDLALECLCLELVGLSRGASEGSTAPAWLGDAVRIVRHSPGGFSSIAQLAEQLGVPPVRLARTFHRRYGLPLWRYVRLSRANIARAMSSGSKTSLTSIAAELGYSDQAHMTRAFKREFGTTPGASRATYPRS